MESPPAPSLDTARLHMRPFVDEDLKVLHAHWTLPDVRRYLFDDVIAEPARIEAIIEISHQLFRERGFGLWLMFDRATDRMVGTSGLMEIHDTPEVELIYSLEPEYWGGGLATEAARELLRFGFEEIGLDRIFAGTDLPNLNSLRVIERLGLKFFGRIRIGLVEGIYYWTTSA